MGTVTNIFEARSAGWSEWYFRYWYVRDNTLSEFYGLPKPVKPGCLFSQKSEYIGGIYNWPKEDNNE